MIITLCVFLNVVKGELCGVFDSVLCHAESLVNVSSLLFCSRISYLLFRPRPHSILCHPILCQSHPISAAPSPILQPCPLRSPLETFIQPFLPIPTHPVLKRVSSPLIPSIHPFYPPLLFTPFLPLLSSFSLCTLSLPQPSIESSRLLSVYSSNKEGFDESIQAYIHSKSVIKVKKKKGKDKQ
jgi:hypothetical protein